MESHNEHFSKETQYSINKPGSAGDEISFGASKIVKKEEVITSDENNNYQTESNDEIDSKPFNNYYHTNYGDHYSMVKRGGYPATKDVNQSEHQKGPLSPNNTPFVTPSDRLARESDYMFNNRFAASSYYPHAPYVPHHGFIGYQQTPPENQGKISCFFQFIQVS